MTKLETINAEDLQNRTYEPTPFLVDELIPEGLHILAGAPKIGKSWLALWLCLCVAQGQPLWNFATTQGEVLYLSLEDSFQRIQTRLFDLTEEAPPTLHFAIMADTLRHGLEQQIEQFLAEHPTTKLVVIDTLQRVRSAGGDSNRYANDYQDVGLLKQLADQHHIAILLIHHLRKLHDDDPMNMISGSTGLSGAADSAFVLQKNARSANAASLHCTGRDIPDRTLKLELDEDDHVWKLLADSKTCSSASKISALQLVHLFSALLRADPAYTGTPSALSAKIDPDGSLGITPKKVTRLVLESVETLRENGILVKIYRSNGKRLISLRSAESADLPAVGKIDPIDPASRPSACAAPCGACCRCVRLCAPAADVCAAQPKKPALRQRAGGFQSSAENSRRSGEKSSHSGGAGKNPPIREEPASRLSGLRQRRCPPSAQFLGRSPNPLYQR